MLKERKRNRNILPGNVTVSQYLKKLRDTDYLEYIKAYQEMYKQAKELETAD